MGNCSKIDVILKEDTKTLDEVVVMALGIKREEKSLGLIAQTINAHAVVDAKSNNWVNTLSGKGVTLGKTFRKFRFYRS